MKIKTTILSLAALLLATPALAAELPKCGAPEVLDTLTKLNKEAAKAKVTAAGPMGMMALAAQTEAMMMLKGKKSDVEVKPFDFESVARFTEKFLALLDTANVTYSGIREETTFGNTKHCAADLHMNGTDIQGDPINKVFPVTYTVQLTEDGQAYVTGTGGADFSNPEDNTAQQLELLRQQQQEQYDEQRQEQDKRQRQRNYDRDVESWDRYHDKLEDMIRR